MIDGVKELLPEIRRLIPASVTLTPIFDQSIFVKAALNSVLMGGLMAAGLTALMILLFLGNWRLTLIILASIPLSILIAVLVLYLTGQTLNTMTLGGFALAVGILVDNATVVIENIERHVRLGEGLREAILNGAAEVGVPTFLSTLSICIVFVPVFLLPGTAKYLFSPLSLSVIISLLASLLLSFTLVPVLFKYLMQSQVAAHRQGAGHGPALHAARTQGGGLTSLFGAVHRDFEHGFERFREAYRNTLAWTVERPLVTAGSFLLLIVVSCLLFPGLGMDFFPQVDAGQMRLHVRAPPATRMEDTQRTSPGRERDPRDRRQRSDRRHAGQYRPAVQRHQHCPERFGDRRPDGWRDPDLAEGKAHADAGAHGATAARSARALSASCSSSFSRRTSSIRC